MFLIIFTSAQIIDQDLFVGKLRKYNFINKISFDLSEWEEIISFINENNHKFIPCPCDLKV